MDYTLGVQGAYGGGGEFEVHIHDGDDWVGLKTLSYDLIPTGSPDEYTVGPLEWKLYKTE